MSSASSTRLVLDTSLFVNPDAQRHFGPNVEETIRRFLEIARAGGVHLLMPVSIFRELSHFAAPEVLDAFRREAEVRGPDIYNLQVPAAIFHSFIRDLRDRVNRGLRVAEKAIQSKGDPESIRWLRAQYREALRTGMVDSVEDLDVILLAKEVRGIILSEDRGIWNMAEELGIEILTAQDFVSRYAADGRGASDG
jgi:RNA ligase partner protein